MRKVVASRSHRLSRHTLHGTGGARESSDMGGSHLSAARRNIACHSSVRGRQRGIALVVALILLVVITLVGLAAVSGTIMQQKMSANFYDRDIAFQETEAAMRQAQIAIHTALATSAAPAGFIDCSSPTPGGTPNNVCLSNPFLDTAILASYPNAIVSVSNSDYNAGSLVASQPQYIVEYMGKFDLPTPAVQQLSGCSGYLPCNPPPKADFFRVTARSGPPNASGRAVVMLQSMFRN